MRKRDKGQMHRPLLTVSILMYIVALTVRDCKYQGSGDLLRISTYVSQAGEL